MKVKAQGCLPFMKAPSFDPIWLYAGGAHNRIDNGKQPKMQIMVVAQANEQQKASLLAEANSPNQDLRNYISASVKRHCQTIEERRQLFQQEGYQ
ncbi:hypothetical protein PCC7424_5433 (plasmid) [Gloeothece citriformis PCC 7424]|uniref:Uncharacterized protein n=2 Tax=Gloeothece TaxID=28070 RepID=B7KMI5_GLOC7|nr:hypothetical protein PCC7424_5433 [Gloeothece citriformis PCC 7424]